MRRLADPKHREAQTNMPCKTWCTAQTICTLILTEADHTLLQSTVVHLVLRHVCTLRCYTDPDKDPDTVAGPGANCAPSSGAARLKALQLQARRVAADGEAAAGRPASRPDRLARAAAAAVIGSAAADAAPREAGCRRGAPGDIGSGTGRDAGRQPSARCVRSLHDAKISLAGVFALDRRPLGLSRDAFSCNGRVHRQPLVHCHSGGDGFSH